MPLPRIPCVWLVLCLVACTGTNRASSDWWSYGDHSNAVQTVAIADLAHTDGFVAVQGVVVDVCQTMGCWLNLRDVNGDVLFVMTRDHDYFVPRNAAGHEVIVNGRARRDIFSVEELRHIAEDAGKPPAEIAAITEPQTRTYFIADTVWIRGPGLDEPVRLKR
jgi:hypothetical protein